MCPKIRYDGYCVNFFPELNALPPAFTKGGRRRRTGDCAGGTSALRRRRCRVPDRWQRQAARPRTGLGTVALPKRGMDDGMERDGWGFLLKSAAHVRVVGA